MGSSHSRFLLLPVCLYMEFLRQLCAFLTVFIETITLTSHCIDGREAVVPLGFMNCWSDSSFHMNYDNLQIYQYIELYLLHYFEATIFTLEKNPFAAYCAASWSYFLAFQKTKKKADWLQSLWKWNEDQLKMPSVGSQSSNLSCPAAMQGYTLKYLELSSNI